MDDRKLQEPLIAQLRRATAARHIEIEQLLGLDGPFDLSWYGQAVRGFDAFLALWEPRAQRALPPALRPWFAARCRGSLARRDREALQLAPAPLDLPLDLGSPSAALGSIYVLEGSALGGQVIARRASAQLGLGPAHGAAYFHGWGPRTGAMWREFQQVLERHEAEGVDREAARDAAVATFEALISTFRQVLHGHATA
jgi:heme oxygenase